MKQEKGNSTHNSNSSEWYFSLKKIEPVNGGRFVEADFTPTLSKQKDNLLKVFPVFNLDKKAYMPSFILPVQNENYEEHERIYQILHEKKLIEANEEKTDLFLPKPSKKNSCCCICRTSYQDYLTHISNPQHQLLMQKSCFNDDIYQLCLGFNLIKRNISQQTLDQEIISEKPKKKRKTQTKKKTSKRNQESGVSTMIESPAFLNNRIIPEALV